MTVLDRKLITRMVNPQPGGNGGGGGAGGAGVYVLPAASNSELGGIKLGYPTGTGKYYPVQLDNQQRAYVNVEWTDHHSWNDLTDFPSATGNSTKPVYWNGSGFTACTQYADAYVAHASNAAAGDIPFMLNGATDNLPRICWHIPNTNWCNLAMDSGGSLHLTETNAKSSTYHALYVGALQAYGNITVGNTTLYAGGSNGDINSLAVADDCILGDCNIGGHLGLKSLNSYDAGISFYTMSGGGLGRVYTNGNFYLYNGSGGYASLYAQNGYAEGTWASKSDARMKNVVGDVDLTVEQIAAMPAVKFTWKNDPEKRVHVGTLAQPWQKVLPEAIETTQADTLMMCYGETAMVSVIKLAQRVLELERMIKK